MIKVFDEKGPFKAINAAEKWIKKKGYSSGILYRDMPIALKKGDYLISKWHNLTKLEKLDIDGHITSKDFRHGPVTVEIFETDSNNA